MKALLFIILFFTNAAKIKAQLDVNLFLGTYNGTRVQYYGPIVVTPNSTFTCSPLTQYQCFDGDDATTVHHKPFKLMDDSTFYDTTASFCRYGYFHHIDSIYVYSCSTQGYWSQFYGKKDTSVSIIESNIELELTVWPIPAITKLKINIAPNLFIKGEPLILRNSMGSIIFKQELDLPEEKIDVSSFADGIYFIDVKTKRGITFKKCVVSRN